MDCLTFILSSFFAFLLSYITKPLLHKIISRYWLYMINISLGIVLAIVILFYFPYLSEKQSEVLSLLILLIISYIVKLCKRTPKGQEHLKLWYDEASEEDDKEYFSQRDMKGKPWWKFMFIPGWITIVMFNFFPILLWLPFIPFPWQDALILQVFGIIITLVVIRNAVVRKRNYDNEYK